PRLAGRDAGDRAEPLSRSAPDRRGEPRDGRRQQHWDAPCLGALLPAAQLGCLGGRGRRRAAHRVCRPAPRGGGRRAAAAQPGRAFAAIGARVSDAVAAGDRVPVPAEARPPLALPEQVLRGRLRSRRGKGGRLALRGLSARAERRRRRGRPLRRGLLHVQRGDGLVLPLPAGRLERLVLSRRRRRARRWGVSRRPALRRERARPPALPRQAPRRARGRGSPAPAPGRRPVAAADLPWRAPQRLSRGGALALVGERGLAASFAVKRVPLVLAALPALGVARLLPADGVGLGLRLGAATACLLIPAPLISRAFRLRGLAPAFAWSFAALLVP